ncbi:hypothetical protein ACP70R_037487 [Stipagrostis hirtigluma subsp. patula]
MRPDLGDGDAACSAVPRGRQARVRRRQPCGGGGACDVLQARRGKEVTRAVGSGSGAAGLRTVVLVGELDWRRSAPATGVVTTMPSSGGEVAASRAWTPCPCGGGVGSTSDRLTVVCEEADGMRRRLAHTRAVGGSFLVHHVRVDVDFEPLVCDCRSCRRLPAGEDAGDMVTGLTHVYCTKIIVDKRLANTSRR